MSENALPDSAGVRTLRPDRSHKGTDSLRRELRFIFLFNAIFLGCLLCPAFSAATHKLFSTGLSILGAFLALPLCWQQFSSAELADACEDEAGILSKEGRNIRIRLRRSSRFIGVGVLSFGLGEMVWAYYVCVLHRNAPLPSLADAAYGSMYVFFMLGLFSLPGAVSTGVSRLRILLDSLIVVTTGATFCWYFLLGPIWLHGELPLWAKAMGITYPLADLILFYCIFSLCARNGDARWKPLRSFLVWGMGLYILSDIVFDYLTLKQAYVPGGMMDVGWTFGVMLLAMAARTAQRAAGDIQTILKRPVAARLPMLWIALLPYAVLPLMGALIYFMLQRPGDESRELGVYFGATALVLLIVVRQALAVLENRKLYQYVQQTNQQLEAQNQNTQEHAEDLITLNAQLRAFRDELEVKNQTLAEANALLESKATTDGLTGILNHRAFQERLHQEMAQAQEEKYTLALLMMDVDYFKRYNDAYGHPAGDGILRGVADLLEGESRSGDCVARYGGEEFVILLPHTEVSAALEIAERIRTRIATQAFPHRQITLSIGIAHQTHTELDPEALVASADQALYAAKHSGRNQVALANDFTLEWEQITEDAGLTALQSAAQNALFQSASFHETSQSLVFGSLEGLLQEPAGLVLSALLAALDLRDAETEGHSQRVARYALRIAQELRCSEFEPLTPGDMRELALGALLHDVGKIGISDTILYKPGALTETEMAQMRQHPEMGAKLLANFSILSPALPVVCHHHERWDGKGYPGNLAAQEIPITARIFALADTLDAMSSNRPYRKGQPYDKIKQEIERLAGTQFDPELVQVFVRIPRTEWERLRHEDRGGAALFGASELMPLSKAA